MGIVAIHPGIVVDRHAPEGDRARLRGFGSELGRVHMHCAIHREQVDADVIPLGSQEDGEDDDDQDEKGDGHLDELDVAVVSLPCLPLEDCDV